MSVSDRTKRQGGLNQLVRTFFQRYDDAETLDHSESLGRLAALRNLPGGALVTFVSEQFIHRTQRNLFGITLIEIKRVLELAKHDSDELRQGFSGLRAQIAEVRSLIQRKS